MATVTNKTRLHGSLSESNTKVRDPLRRLRGYIRGYVIGQALAVLIICLAICFWVGLAFDYLAFKYLSIDLTRDLPRWIRAVFLGAGLLFTCFFVELRRLIFNPPKTRTGRISVAKNRQRNSIIIAIAVPSLILYITLWVFIALLRDSGNLTALHVGLFVAALVVLFTMLVVVKRMLYDFSDPALAIVLERRFPKTLGDRLITAVELSDPNEAAKLGYSSVMVEQTIHEAAERVEQLNIREVFDWKRLYLQVGFALLLTAGVYAGTVVTMMIVAKAQEREPGMAQIHELDDNAGLWAQRNLLLDNERWPTRCLIVFDGFDGKQKKFGKSAESNKEMTSVPLSARAIEYAVRDSKAPECWRALALADILENRIPILTSVTPHLLPDGWVPRDLKAGLTIDEIKLNRDDPALDKSVKKAIGELLDDIDEAAKHPSMSRTLRKLSMPKELALNYKNVSGSGKGDYTMKPAGDNTYYVDLELRESVDFFIVAEDYISESKRIVLVEPPHVVALKSIERRPAYLYHYWQNDADRQNVARSKQLGEPVKVNVAGELKPRVNVPTGTDVILEGETDKELAEDGIRPDPSRAAAFAGARFARTGPNSFTMTFPDVRSDLDIRLLLKDTDGALGVQELIIIPQDDANPTVNQFKPEVVRSVGESKFKVTPMAVIPFSFFVTDLQGLDNMEFVYSIKEASSDAERKRRALYAAGGIGLVLSGSEAPLASYGYNLYLPVAIQSNTEMIEGRLPVEHFKDELRKIRSGADWTKTKALLDSPINFDRRAQGIGMRLYDLRNLSQLDSYLNDHEKAVEDSKPFKGMDLSQIKWKDKAGVERELKANKDRHEVQRRYEMEVWLEVTDNNIARVNRRPSRSSSHNFEIVSEIELTFDVYQEEQRLYDELARVAAELKRGTDDLQRIKFDIPLAAGASVNFDAYSVRVEEVQKIYLESKRITDKVHKDYDKVLRELRTNRMENREYLKNVKDNIVIPLHQLLNDDFLLEEGGKKVRCGFLGADLELKGLRQTIDNVNIPQQKRLDDSRIKADFSETEFRRLTQSLNEILLQMKGVLTLNELIGNLNRIQTGTLESLRKVEERKRIIEADIFKDLEKPK